MPEIDPKDGDKGTAGAGPAAGAGAPPPEAVLKKLEFTQEEFDRIIADRVSRAKPKDYDDLVKLREEREAAAEKEKTDLQREKDARAAAEAKAKETESRAHGILKRAAIIEQAAAQNAADADVIVALLASDDSITIEGDEVKGVKQAVKKLLESKPFLVKTAGGSASGGQFGGNDQRTVDEQIAAAEAKGDFKTSRRLKLVRMMSQG